MTQLSYSLGVLFLTLGLASGQAPKEAFHFEETKGEYTDLKFGSREVLRFVTKPRDGTTKDTHYLTFKPFLQVFDPKTGMTNLTSGAHPNTKDFLYPHHRGLFFGFNKITYGDKQTADIWHGTNNVYSTEDKVTAQDVNEKSATRTAVISWHGTDGKAFAEETRTVTAMVFPDAGTQIDWSTVVTTALPKVRLDGDPQHAGFHFRASQDVSKTGKETTYYLRPDGKGKVGETRNWVASSKDPKEVVKDPRTVNLRWNACSFVIARQRYTVVRINHPDNPRDTRGSERDYGRFGDYFEYDLTPQTPLKLKYRVWVQEGEMTVQECASKAADFEKGK